MARACFLPMCCTSPDPARLRAVAAHLFCSAVLLRNHLHFAVAVFFDKLIDFGKGP